MANAKASPNLEALPTSPSLAQTLPSDAVLEALTMILLGVPLNEVLTTITRLIEAHSTGMLCSIFLLEEDGLHLRYGVAASLPEAYRAAVDGICIGPSVGSCGTAAYLRQPVFVSDIASDPRWAKFRHFALKNGLRSAWSTPIMSRDDELLGTFCMYHREVRRPGPAEIKLIDYASRIAGIAIERDRSQTALTRAFEQIEKSEAQLRHIVDAIPQMIAVLNPDGTILYMNQTMLDYTGLTIEEAMAKDVRDRAFNPDDVARFRGERLESLSRDVPFQNEKRILRKDGQYRWFLIHYNPLLGDQGRVIRWYATGTDIEHRKQAENKLRQEGRELRQLIDFLPQHVLVLDQDGTLLQANKTMLDYNGLTLEEMKGEGTRERDIHPDDLERVRTERSAGLSRGMPFEVEKRLLGKDGQSRWFLFRFNPVLDEGGDIVRWFATATDIEDRKQAEDRMRNEAVTLREDIVHSSMFEEIVGSSPSLRKVLKTVDKVSATDSTVLILGETGTGKELIARAIHKRSPRSSRAFIRVNCAAIPSELIASELFGHLKDAFTGALERRIGRFEAADGGTLFLDEIGDLPAETQITLLLRVLQEREFERIGSTKPVQVDVRVLAATNRDLAADVDEGFFRRDLYYRLNVFPVDVPPLRERIEDIPLLAEYLVQRYSKKAGKKIASIDRLTLEMLRNYDWPGNVRELQNVIERAVILCETPVLYVDETWFRREAHSRLGNAFPSMPPSTPASGR